MYLVPNDDYSDGYLVLNDKNSVDLINTMITVKSLSPHHVGGCWMAIMEQIGAFLFPLIGPKISMTASQFTEPPIVFQNLIQASMKIITKGPFYWTLCRDTPVSSGFPAQRASNARSVSILWCHNVHTGSDMWSYTGMSTRRCEINLNITHSSHTW